MELNIIHRYVKIVELLLQSIIITININEGLKKQPNRNYFIQLTGASNFRSFILLRDGDISVIGKLLTRCALRSLTQPHI